MFQTDIIYKEKKKINLQRHDDLSSDATHKFIKTCATLKAYLSISPVMHLTVFFIHSHWCLIFLAQMWANLRSRAHAV